MTTRHTLHETSEAFMGHLQELGKKERTIYTYKKDLEVAESFFGTDKPLTEIQSWQVGKFLKSNKLLKLTNGKMRAERTVAKTVRVFRMMMVWAQQTGLITELPLPKSTPMGRDQKKDENNDEAGPTQGIH